MEHRFYGESIPYGNATTENYRYLTVEQALADLAGFTAFYKSLVPQTADAKWVAFGGSYPGALSSWYRSSYPSLTVGSLSSSGVVNCIIDYQVLYYQKCSYFMELLVLICPHNKRVSTCKSRQQWAMSAPVRYAEFSKPSKRISSSLVNPSTLIY